jgi:diguanylate cyclase (GGDEF)-like protein
VEKAISTVVETDAGQPAFPSLFARLKAVALPDSLPRFACVLGLYLVASWGGNSLTLTPAVADLLWPANGLLLAFLLPIARRYWTSYLVSTVAINLIVHVAFGFSIERALLYSVANTIEVIVAALLLGEKDGTRPDLTSFPTLARFIAFGVLLAPITSTGFMEMILALWAYPRHPQMLSNWLTGDIMGMALMTPLFLAMERKEFRRLLAPEKRLETIAILAGVATVSIAVFAQKGLPLDFLVIPALLIAVFRLRATGGAIAILLIAAPSVYMTERAHGAFSISGASSDHHGFLILQLFLCVNVVILYAVNAALTARDRLQAEITDAYHEADTKATRDYGTGLANRLSFDRQLAREWQFALREEEAISLLLVDVDHFKLYNDHYGHLAGDECLRRVANILSITARRSTDMVSRFGGEEFALILPAAPDGGAFTLAERIRQAVLDSQIAHLPYTAGMVTVSIGVATLVPTPKLTKGDLVKSADRALYEAKRLGRNRVSVWDSSQKDFPPHSDMHPGK